MVSKSISPQNRSCQELLFIKVLSPLILRTKFIKKLCKRLNLSRGTFILVHNYGLFEQ